MYFKNNFTGTIFKRKIPIRNYSASERKFFGRQPPCDLRSCAWLLHPNIKNQGKGMLEVPERENYDLKTHYGKYRLDGDKIRK